MTTFRLATINVHSFRKPSDYKRNISELVSILEPLNLDLIAVQEIQNKDQWEEFSGRLSLPHSASGSCNGYSFGNGIASRYPIKSYSHQETTFHCEGGNRSILQCSLDDVENLSFAVTHLDHLDEDVRLKQINEFKPHKKNIDILMGDMNALTREDYSNEYYQNIVAGKRERSKWEKPRFDLTELITHQWDYQDALKLINPQIKDEQIATCDYGTRIDYIYVHPRVNDQWTLTQCSIIDTKGVVA
jgi:endonuclease/exonuclease/phosphatase family metal-dependent hydrolase